MDRTLTKGSKGHKGKKRTRALCLVSLVAALFFSLAAPAGADPADNLNCLTCKKAIGPGSKYLKTANGVYCSDPCFQASLPTCAACGKHTAEGVVITSSIERLFCRKCAAKPKCFCCAMPANCRPLDDDRPICPECLKTAVMDNDKITAVAEEVRTLMKDKLHLSTDHQIKYVVADIHTLEKKSRTENNALELGTYLYEELTEKTVTTKKNLLGKVLSRETKEDVTRTHSIYLLFGMSRNKLVEVAAHELAHDWMQAYYPGIKDLKIQEGWAEYVATLVNTLYGRSEMNMKMERNPSPVYGGGYRLIRDTAKKGSPELTRLLEQHN